MSANIELVTAHKGAPHITVDQVRDLIVGCVGREVTGVQVLADLDTAFYVTFTGATSLRIGTGQALANGFFFQLLDAFDWELDPGAVGYSRIDSLYLVIYEDAETLVQTADFVYIPGELYPNGTTPIYPDPPSGSNIKESFEFMRAQSSDGSIVSQRDLFSVVHTNLQLYMDMGGLKFGIDQHGRYGYYKVGADTVTPFRTPQGTATPDEVLQGYTFSNEDDDLIEGQMEDIEEKVIDIDLNPGDLPYTYVEFPYAYIRQLRIHVDNA